MALKRLVRAQIQKHNCGHLTEDILKSSGPSSECVFFIPLKENSYNKMQAVSRKFPSFFHSEFSHHLRISSIQGLLQGGMEKVQKDYNA